MEHLLRDRFGFDTFKPGQREAIEHLLGAGRAAAVFPTGGGKSLCYQLPALVFDGLTLVVSPLIALMKDQIDTLATRGIAARRLDSSVEYSELRQTQSMIARGELRMLYVAPERFNNERFRQSMRGVPIALFAVDEAHCISEWGHNFRPDYLKLAQYAREFNAQRVLALTATATPTVLADMCRQFEIPKEAAVATGFYRPNLTLLLTPISDAQRDIALLDRLKKRPPGATIVYATSRQENERLAERLREHGYDARPYHAGMENDDRGSTQEWFMTGEGSERGIVCATIAFGMGVDKSDIRYVYHYNLSKSIENYSQEIGRAGRDGEPSICEMFVCHDDLEVLEKFVYDNTPEPMGVLGLVRQVFLEGERFDVSVYDLGSDHGIKPLVVKTLLTYLELEGYLEGGTPFYSVYKFKPILDSKAILGRFKGERREFLGNMFRCARRAKVWFTIDSDAASRRLGCTRDRVVAALDYLGKQGMIQLAASQVRLRYTRLKMPDDPASLARSLHTRMSEGETREIGRLHALVDLAEARECQVNRLAAHFGEQRSEACGHCTWCLRKGGRAPA